MAKTFCVKDTFWNRLRVERNITLEELADYMGVSQSLINQWFTGALIPRDDDISKLCELFDVSMLEGTVAFQQANRQYVAGKFDPCISNGQQEVSDKPKADKPMVVETPKTESSAVLDKVYGNIPYGDFVAFANAIESNDSDALSLIYGKVSYETYSYISSIINKP